MAIHYRPMDRLPCLVMGDTSMSEHQKPTPETISPYQISGPYQYAGDRHTSWSIRDNRSGGIVASVFAYDSEDAAWKRACVMARALLDGESS